MTAQPPSIRTPATAPSTGTATPVDCTLADLLHVVRACRVCAAHLPHGPRPVLQAGAGARILVVGQAPGASVHGSGVPWADASGDRLRAWMGVDEAAFYDAERIALIPMGLCYPGRGASGDLPPRPECAPLWMDALLAKLPRIELTLLVGVHAQRRFLGAYFSDRGRPFQSDRGRRNGIAKDTPGRRTSTGFECSSIVHDQPEMLSCEAGVGAGFGLI